MGYKTKDIADITEPARVSLAKTSNFVQFASKPSVKTFFDVDIQLTAVPSTPDVSQRTVLRVTDPSGRITEFHGTTVASEVGGSVFYVAQDTADTAENLRQALLNNAWLAANFDIRIPSVWSGSNVANGNTLSIRGKAAGAAFVATVAAPNNAANSAYIITVNSATSTDTDSIKGNADTVEIELDMYEGANVFLGADDRPTDEDKLGTLAVVMQKTYAGQPVWFDVNGPVTQYGPYNLPREGWFPTGTVRVFRFVAKVRGINSFTFYQSSALFAITGYTRFSDPVDMTPYIYGAQPLRLLTNAPRVPLAFGQTAYLNFIYSDDRAAGKTYPPLAPIYRAYSASGNYLGQRVGLVTTGAALAVVNSLRLNFAPILEQHPNAGEIRVALTESGSDISNELRFEVGGECLHKLFEVTFLNKLGGWDVFNFDADPSIELARESETYFKTPRPDLQGGLEHTYDVDIEQRFTVEGPPVSDEVAEWLTELAASPVVLGPDGRQIIIETFTLPRSVANKNMHIPAMQYRINDTYTND